MKHPVFKKVGSRSQFSDELRKTQGKRGVYTIYYIEKPIYVGHSHTNTYKTLTRHFQSWNDNQYRVSFPPNVEYNFSFRDMKNSTTDEILEAESAAILNLKPAYNIEDSAPIEAIKQKEEQALKVLDEAAADKINAEMSAEISQDLQQEADLIEAQADEADARGEEKQADKLEKEAEKLEKEAEKHADIAQAKAQKTIEKVERAEEKIEEIAEVVKQESEKDSLFNFSRSTLKAFENRNKYLFAIAEAKQLNVREIIDQEFKNYKKR